MTQTNIYLGMAGLLLILVAIFTPIGALFLSIIGIIAAILIRLSQTKK